MSRLVIRTAVGCAGMGDNFVRGRSIRHELFGVDSYWSLLSLSIGGPRLDAAESRFVDDLALAICSPDPRIWPLKITWLAGSYGSPLMASAAALLFFESAIVGPWACVAACEPVRELRALSETPRLDEAVESWWNARRHTRVPGFGVAMREHDERVPLVLEAAALRSERPHLKALLRALPAIARLSSLKPNIGAVLAACLLDMGYDDQQVGVVSVEMVRAQLLGNAVEASRAEAACLRALPEDAMRYAGRPSRPSPRRSQR